MASRTTETHEIFSLSEMRNLAGAIARSLGPRVLLILNGPMGAGKTQFTRFLMEELGSDETCSPSFAIHNSYSSSRGAIEHLDLFRLESEEDLESTGFWDFFLEPKGVVIVEWGSRLEEMGLGSSLPMTWPRIELTFEAPDGEGERRLVRQVTVEP